MMRSRRHVEPSIEEMLTAIREIMAQDLTAETEDAEIISLDDKKKMMREQQGIEQVDASKDDDILELTEEFAATANEQQEATMAEDDKQVEQQPSTQEEGSEAQEKEALPEEASAEKSDAEKPADDKPAETDSEEAPLELSEPVEEEVKPAEGEAAAEKSDAEKPAETSEARPNAAMEDIKEPSAEVKEVFKDEDLVSEQTLADSRAALSGLTSLQQNLSESIQKGSFGQKTLEELMQELMRPLLKEWLDAHLPSLVKWLVTEQIEKMFQNKK